MTEKLYEYQGCLGRLHTVRDEARERYFSWKEGNPQGVAGWIKKKLGVLRGKMGQSRIFRIFTGLILVPNGERLGYAFGDEKPPNATNPYVAAHRTTTSLQNIITETNNNRTIFNGIQSEDISHVNSHPWGVFFTVIGTVLLDFDADACQSPARAYLLDVTIPEDHARGLSTFTVMAGLGGFFGYALGGINWDATAIGILLGGHVRAVFTLITVLFVVCVAYTVTSFKEIPLRVLELQKGDSQRKDESDENTAVYLDEIQTYGTLEEEEDEPKVGEIKLDIVGADQGEDDEKMEILREPRRSIAADPNASLLLYLQSIVYMPHSIRMLCLTNLFCWMAHVCYSLYFTDFVGEAVFEGNPTAVEGSTARELYESGVRFGCWGMSMYSLSCACYSMKIEHLISRYGAKKVYIGGLLIYSTGMLLMALSKHQIGVIIFSWTAGVMYSTLFTMPYLLVATYHAKGTFEITTDGKAKSSSQIRGLGTDVALVSSMVFLAQFILSMVMGGIVNATGTTTAVVSVASTLAFFGAISATQIMYLDL
ncbi:hypothetical protein NQ318_007067 [Aromia moschata]|uniref:Proton-associated sugar transporter A n=1 Tax=Aromia moschata TaxID=1265417 RepID=A0AAV8X9A0_9CUCU|nr:hypothetical protein NQ318_007067 [Aromia moschata]